MTLSALAFKASFKPYYQVRILGQVIIRDSDKRNRGYKPLQQEHAVALYTATTRISPISFSVGTGRISISRFRRVKNVSNRSTL